MLPAPEFKMDSEFLISAIRAEEFRLVFQPQYDLSSLRVTGFEALLRWQHPVHGPISPDQFIPAAEASGVIDILDSWVLHRACSEAVEWPREIGVSVNFSPGGLMRNDISDLVARAIRATGFQANRLTLEITEGSRLEFSNHTKNSIRKAHLEGVRFSIDDFGQGYSSLAYLMHFPISEIKLDKSFVARIHSKSTFHIVEAIIKMADDLGVGIVAEGIENMYQLMALQEMKCQSGQGFFFCRPIESKDIPNILSRT